MSLATRCSACGTAFRVVQEQLKVSEGWVRCGHCGEVFDALEGLFDLERDPATDWPATGLEPSAATVSDTATVAEPVAAAGPDARPSGPPAQASTAAAQQGGNPARMAPTAIVDTMPSPPLADPPAFFVDPGRPTPAAETPPPADPAQNPDPIDAQLFQSRRGERRRASAVQAWDHDRPDFSDARYDSDLAAEPDPDSAGTEAIDSTADPSLLESAAAHPEFLRRAEHRARWERPRARAVLLGIALTAVLGLGLQIAHHFRDEVAARWTGAAPMLATWCGWVGCRLEAPRHIEQISVESTILARVPGSDAFRLAVTLRNRAATPLATPSLDLTLTDAGGRLVIRKALAPLDLTPPMPTLGPGAEVVLQSLLETSDPRVIGYTVEIFYP